MIDIEGYNTKMQIVYISSFSGTLLVKIALKILLAATTGELMESYSCSTLLTMSLFRASRAGWAKFRSMQTLILKNYWLATKLTLTRGDKFLHKRLQMLVNLVLNQQGLQGYHTLSHQPEMAPMQSKSFLEQENQCQRACRAAIS